MKTNLPQFLGDSIATERLTVVNKTGAALVVGGIYALDLAQSDGDTSGATDKVRAALSNVVAVSSSNINGVLVVAESAIADDEEGQVIVSGPVKASLNGAVSLGSRLKAVSAQTYLQAASSAAGSVDVGVGTALEALASGTASKLILFNGWAFASGALNVADGVAT